MNRKKILFTVLVILCCVTAVQLGKRIAHRIGVFHVKAKDSARTKGVPAAALWISEYLDFQCSSCRTAHEVLKNVLSKHGNEIYYQVRFFPLPVHTYGLATAIAAKCAANQKAFWEYEDLLFGHQGEWSSSEDVKPFLRQYAEMTGLDLEKWHKCFEDPETEKEVTEEKKNAEALGVVSTPTFFIGNKKIVGAQNLKKELRDYFKVKK